MTAGHALVVGGTRGLGKVIAERFVSRGLDVTILSRSKVAEQGIRHIAVDLETLSNTDGIASKISEFGALRYICFCQRFRGTGDSFRGEMQVGLNASRLLIEGLANHFATDGDRAIAVVSSVYAEFVGGSQPLGYHVAKAGLNQMVRFFAWQMGRKGVRINAIMPLTFAKPESRNYYQSNARLRSMYDKLVPLGRMGDAEDCANAVDFLCSDKATFINGQCIRVDGGVSVMWPEHIARELSGV